MTNHGPSTMDHGLSTIVRINLSTIDHSRKKRPTMAEKNDCVNHGPWTMDHGLSTIDPGFLLAILIKKKLTNNTKRFIPSLLISESLLSKTPP